MDRKLRDKYRLPNDLFTAWGATPNGLRKTSHASSQYLCLINQAGSPDRYCLRAISVAGSQMIAAPPQTTLSRVLFANRIVLADSGTVAEAI
jgi:hypothetical protein